MTKNILSITNLQVAYGGIQAVKGIALEVHEGELVTLIGANGAGKTTTLKAITGTLPECRVDGRIDYLGQSLQGRKAFQLVQGKLAMVPEGRGVFTRMSIQENLLMGAYTRNDKAQIDADIERWFGVFPRLKERAAQMAGTLSGGEQQMLAMARALMLQPEVLLLDEPSMGLAPRLVEDVFRTIERLKAARMTTLLVEQFAAAALDVADYGYVLENGHIARDGPAATLKNDPAVRAAYLGAAH